METCFEVFLNALLGMEAGGIIIRGLAGLYFTPHRGKSPSAFPIHSRVSGFIEDLALCEDLL